jgi:hypothetical protein
LAPWNKQRLLLWASLCKLPGQDYAANLNRPAAVTLASAARGFDSGTIAVKLDDSAAIRNQLSKV